MTKGLFISFEGGDGSGKSTQIEKLKEHIETRGFETLVTREPGGTKIGEAIREIILSVDNMDMTPLTEAYLYAASRAQHVDEVIKPALKEGKVVICDRYIDSSVAYQGYARGLGDMVKELNSFATGGLMPDLTFLMELEPKTGKRRTELREEDRIELEKLDFHESVFEGYRRIKEESDGRVIGIDASGTIEETSKAVISGFEEYINDTF